MFLDEEINSLPLLAFLYILFSLLLKNLLYSSTTSSNVLIRILRPPAVHIKAVRLYSSRVCQFIPRPVMESNESNDVKSLKNPQ